MSLVLSQRPWRVSRAVGQAWALPSGPVWSTSIDFSLFPSHLVQTEAADSAPQNVSNRDRASQTSEMPSFLLLPLLPPLPSFLLPPPSFLPPSSSFLPSSSSSSLLSLNLRVCLHYPPSHPLISQGSWALSCRHLAGDIVLLSPTGQEGQQQILETLQVTVTIPHISSH